MNKKERQQIIYQISDILDTTCKACTYIDKNKKDASKYCYTECGTGKELQRLGKILDPQQKPPKIKEEINLSNLTQEAYESMKKEGKSDAAISKFFGINQATLIYHKKKWTVPKKVEKPKQEKKPEKVKVEKEVNSFVDTYMQEIDNLKKQLLESRARVSQLEALADELAEEKDNLTAACEDLENEVNVLKNKMYVSELAYESLEKENDNLIKKDFGNIERLENENAALRQLLKVVL